MSFVTMFFAVPPTALVPSWTPFHGNSLNDLCSSGPISVTIPIFKPPPRSPPPPQPATTSPKARPSARRRFMSSSDLPQFVALARDAANIRSGENAPQDVPEKYDVQAPAQHERRERQRVLPRADPELQVDQESREEREHGSHRPELPELPRRQEDADGHRERRLEDHRAGDVPKRDDIFPIARPDERVRRLGKLGRERREDERDEKRVEVHGVGEVLDEVSEEARSDDDRGERDDRLGEHKPQRRRGIARRDPGALEQRHEGQLVERLALLHLLLDVLRTPARRSKDEIEVEEVRRKEDPAQVALEEVQVGREERQTKGDRVEHEEEGQIAERVRRVHVQRVALALLPENERREADEKHHERPEHEGGAEDRADADLVGIRAVREQDRDDGDERLGRRGP